MKLEKGVRCSTCFTTWMGHPASFGQLRGVTRDQNEFRGGIMMYCSGTARTTLPAATTNFYVYSGGFGRIV